MDYDPLEVIRAESAAFAAAARSADPSTPVPPCPGWTLRDLVAHLGSVHRRFAAHVAVAGTERPSGPAAEAPADGLLEWFEDGVDALITVLGSVDPRQRTWNRFSTPQVASFWARRMALETAIHRWDAEAARRDADAAPSSPRPFRMEVALDGVDEVLAIRLPADRLDQGDADAPPAVGTVRVDVDGRSWLVRMGEGAATDVGPAEGAGAATDVGPAEGAGAATDVDAVVAGAAGDIFLALWGRVPIEPHVVEGDHALAAALRTA